MRDVVVFGRTTLDLRTRTLRRDGRTIPLQSQPFDLLVLLVARADTVVTRESMRETIWPDVVVEYDQNINFAIRQIRLALGPDADRLQTIPRRGYRFVGPVAARTPRRRAFLATAAAAAFVFAFGAGIVSAHTPSGASIYEHLVHPDHCPYLRFLFPSHTS
ncbi:MAG TPA: winged helix-turn-helix domain-containing protein [Vicinamibacterales bacterium]|nr:winged helix-turn-helix domain-containing protein [Vicinamibacterales bacterium]